MIDPTKGKEWQAKVDEISDEETLRHLNRMVCDRLRSIQTDKNIAARSKFKQGDKVEFTRSKTGRVMKGTLSRVNYSRGVVKVEAAPGQFAEWTVPLSMLRAG